MNTRRLLLLARFMETKVPRKGFTMETYFHACGSPACVLAWATTIPSLRRAGLDGVDAVFSFRTVRDVFGITGAQWVYLFADSSIRTPKQAAANIRRVVAEHKAAHRKGAA